MPYQPTPEDIVCQRETLALLLSILDTCTAIQREPLHDCAMHDQAVVPGVALCVPLLVQQNLHLVLILWYCPWRI